jgi:signal transduction histidine kinase
LLGAAWPVFAAAVLAAEPRSILVLYSNNRLVPGNIAVDRGLRDGLSNASEANVEIHSEFLDFPAFSGEAYESTVSRYLREKYAARPPDAIVPVVDQSLAFVLRHRAELFPGIAVVHAVVSASFLRSLGTLPADVVGVPFEYDFAGTIEQALRWHPDAGKLLVVTGNSERDREWEARLRREVPAVAGLVRVEFLAGQPTASVLQRLGALDAETVVFTPGYYEDGAGRPSNPARSAAQMAGVSRAPLYGPFDTFIGTGAVGGRTPSFEATGKQAAQIVTQIFGGVSPASLRVPDLSPNALRVDWRAVQRWGIDENAIPADTVVSFRPPSFWQAYRELTIAVAVVFATLMALIASLLVERRRRHVAEVEVQGRRIELAHASRLAVAGELTASIAHEINQPLGAVQTSADAADLILQSGEERREDLLRIVSRIRRDSMRASDVIRRLRALLARHTPEREPFDLNGAASDAVNLLRTEARRRDVDLAIRTSSTPAWVVGDQTQIQQVLINLLLNAMDAVVDVSLDRREVVVSVESVDSGVRVTVRDRGSGIAPEHLPKLFDSFFSTKQRGMGLGLSIARTIVEAHGGRIRAGNAPDGGALFEVEFPAREPASALATGPA